MSVGYFRVGYRDMKLLKTSFAVVGFLWASLHVGQDVQAYSSHQMNDYTAYPLPVEKPAQSCVSGDKNDDLDQKQAAAAALGLYLGLKIATAPSGYQTDETEFTNCAI